MDAIEAGFLKVTVDPERVRIRQRNEVLSGGRKVTLPGQQIGNPAVDRRTNLRTLEVDPRLVQPGGGLLELRLRHGRVGRISLLFLNGYGQIRQLLPALRLALDVPGVGVRLANGGLGETDG